MNSLELCFKRVKAAAQTHDQYYSKKYEVTIIIILFSYCVQIVCIIRVTYGFVELK